MLIAFNLLMKIIFFHSTVFNKDRFISVSSRVGLSIIMEVK